MFSIFTRTYTLFLYNLVITEFINENIQEPSATQ